MIIQYTSAYLVSEFSKLFFWHHKDGLNSNIYYIYNIYIYIYVGLYMRAILNCTYILKWENYDVWFNNSNFVTSSIYFFATYLAKSILIFQYRFISCSHYIHQIKIFTRQVGVWRKIKVMATVFRATFRVAFFFQQLIKTTFNIQSIKHYCFFFSNFSKYLL